MKLDLSKISNMSEVDFEPRAIFNSLVNKSKKYNGYLRDVQSEVLDSWFEQRNKKDNIIKMNTGSGKTVVALLILQSSLVENKGKCIYVVPDTFLIEQVKKEAKDLGIPVVTEYDDIDFLRGKAILIITIFHLVNGKSRFGMSRQDIDVDTILVDDVHSCIEISEQQCTLTINRRDDKKIYLEFLKLFSGDLEFQHSINFTRIESGDYAAFPMLVPFWCWQSKLREVERLLLKGTKETEFKLPLLEDILELCHCTISYNRIQISPKCTPIEKISKFENASRRIYLSATLADNGSLVSHFNVNPDEIEKIIVPKKASDIGDRMILYPQAITPGVTDTDIKEQLNYIAKKFRVVVIVPSRQRAEFWKDVASHIFDKDNLTDIKNYNSGLDVLVNRYEGIDLPDDKCRLLVIDGLPIGKTDYTTVKEMYLENYESIVKSKIQKIEQGMGRGVRSNEDYCGVILMGKDLTHTMYNSNGLKYFSSATREQYVLSEEISNQLKGHPVNEILSVLKYCLKRESEWVGLGKRKLNSTISVSDFNISDETLIIRKSFNFALHGDISGAVEVFNNIRVQDNECKGWLYQEKAEYLNKINPVQAQTLQKSAKEKNRRLLKPIEGIEKRHLNGGIFNQAENVNKILSKFDDKNKFLIKLESVIDHLKFIPYSENKIAFETFENSIKDIGSLIGFISTRPEKEEGDGGPDNLWISGSNKNFIIECKNGATSSEISKDDCSQLLSSVQWFNNNYTAIDSSCQPIPILIHCSYSFASDASPSPDFLIVGEKELAKFITAVKKFSLEAFTYKNDIKNISMLLKENNLLPSDIIQNYTSKYY